MRHKTWGQWVTALQGLDNKSCLIITTWHRCFRDFSGFSKLWLRMFGKMEDRIRTLTMLHSISHTERRVLSRGLLEIIHLKACHCKHCDYIHSLTFTSKERHASYWETVMIRRSVTYGYVNAYTHTCTQSPWAPFSPNSKLSAHQHPVQAIRRKAGGQRPRIPLSGTRAI